MQGRDLPANPEDLSEKLEKSIAIVNRRRKLFVVITFVASLFCYVLVPPLGLGLCAASLSDVFSISIKPKRPSLPWYTVAGVLLFGVGVSVLTGGIAAPFFLGLTCLLFGSHTLGKVISYSLARNYLETFDEVARARTASQPSLSNTFVPTPLSTPAMLAQTFPASPSIKQYSDVNTTISASTLPQKMIIPTAVASMNAVNTVNLEMTKSRR